MNSLWDPSYALLGTQIQPAALCSRGPCRRGLFWTEHFCVHSTRQDPAADAGIFVPTVTLERHWRFGQFLFLLKVMDFDIILNGQHNQSSRGDSPPCVIKCVHKLLSQYFISHSFN